MPMHSMPVSRPATWLPRSVPDRNGEQSAGKVFAGRDDRAVTGLIGKIGMRMRSSFSIRAMLAVGALAAAFVVVPAGQAHIAAAAGPCTLGGLCAGGEYHPLTPTRIFDTGDSSVPPINDVAPLGGKPLSLAKPTFNIGLLGLGGVPLSGSDVLAVVVNITIAQPGVSGWLGAYPSGVAPADDTSLLNFRSMQTTSNLAVVRAGADGKLTVKLFGNGAVGAAKARVVVDVFGWISTSTYGTASDFTGEYRGARLVPLAVPTRILDTRNDAAPDTPLGAGTDLSLTVWGATPIDSSGAAAVPTGSNVVGVVANITAVAPTRATFITAQPDSISVGTPPTTSNLNPAAGQVKANLVIVPLDANGVLHLYNHAGSVNVVVDVIGVLETGTDEATRKGRIVPLTSPFRAFDTRQPAFGNVPLGPGQAENWSFANFASSVTINSRWVGNQLGLLGNLTVATMMRQYPTVPASSYLTVYPGGGSLPLASNLNFGEAEAIPNMVMARYDASQVLQVFNFRGYTHYLLDVSAVILDD